MKYWAGKTKDGKEVNENNSSWHDIKNNLAELWLVIDNFKVSLPPNLKEYNQLKSCSSLLGSGKIEIEARNISGKLGNNTVKIRVDEKTNNIKVEIEIEK